MNLKEPSSYRVAVRVPLWADERHIQRELEHARRRMAADLLEKLPYSRYFVIRIDEQWPPEAKYYDQQYRQDSMRGYGDMEYRLEVRIREVETERVRLPYYEEFDYGALSRSSLATSAVQEIGFRIKRGLKNLIKRK